MGFSKKITAYFKERGMSKRDISKAMDNYNEQLIGRYMNSDDISKTFIKKLTKYFPEIDIDYMIKDDNLSIVNEPREEYRKKSEVLIEEIEEKLKELKLNMTRV
jgi:DNA-binding transcriptional MerR regulator